MTLFKELIRILGSPKIQTDILIVWKKNRYEFAVVQYSKYIDHLWSVYTETGFIGDKLDDRTVIGHAKRFLNADYTLTAP